ncbi:MAG: preprotein translocase subunit YajC [Planctomycetes bacterium]|nr:preprotein translocase subunit YajC [Planctomycetota bacterium]
MTRIENEFTLVATQEAGPGLPPGLQGEAMTQAPGGQSGNGDTTGPGGKSTGGSQFFLMLLPILLLFIFITSMGGRKERKRRKAMISGLKKRDRVQTQGGIIGVITEMKDDEIVLKVDEGSNTKIRFARSAVQQVLRSSASESSDSSQELEEASVS